jgi:uncharacterized membrane protein
MPLLIAGLVLFLGVHSVAIIAPEQRAHAILRYLHLVGAAIAPRGGG